MKSKLIELSDLKEIKDCSLVYGHFDAIHPGHIRYLNYAKSISKKLVVAIIGDFEKNSFYKFNFKQKERYETLSMLDIVDFIVCLVGEELSEVVKKCKPKTLVLGKEKETTNNFDFEIRKAINLQKQQGGKVEFRAGEVNYSFTDLLFNSEREIEEKRKIEFLNACKKQNITSDTLLKAISTWHSLKLIVVGDLIVDQYAACEALGISAEAPVVVVKELQQKNFLGGAGIVASHIRALGAKCDLFSVVGNDDTKKFVNKIVNSSDIGNFLYVDSKRPTTLKKRYIVDNQKLFRVSRLAENSINQDVEEKIIRDIELSAKSADAIIISDFVYGVVTEKIIKKIRTIAKRYNLILVADLQCSSQIGSILKFKDFSLLCPNEKEARIALQDKINGLEYVSQQILAKTRAERLIMKLGASGFIAYDNSLKNNINRQSFPALSVNPVDVSGAGDSLLSVMSMGLASGHSTMLSAALATCMASLVVNNMGNIPVDYESLKKMVIEIFYKN